MSTTTPLTFESVNAHIEKYYVPAKPGEKTPAMTLCSAYATVKPALQLAILILPSKWKEAIQTLMAILDAQCS